MKTIKDRVSIIIPNYKGISLLEKNLPYLIQAVEFSKKNHQIIVVDDAGFEVTKIYIKRMFPQVEVITLPKNFGFGQACNLAAKVSLHPLVLFLNNDVRVSRDFLQPLIDSHQQEDTFGVIPKIMVSDTGVNESVYELNFRSGYFSTRLLEKEKVDKIKGEFPVPFGCGACLLVDKKKFFQLGGFSSIFHPFYWEDVDLGYRAWKRGWKVFYEPESIVFHQRGATIGDGSLSPEVDKIFLRNMILFTWKNFHSPSIILRHLFTLPFDLFFAYVGKRKIYIEAFKEATKRLKESLVLRKKEREELLYGDCEVLSFLKSNLKRLSFEEGISASVNPPSFFQKTISTAQRGYKKILIVHNRGGMGDVILSTPLVLTLKKNFSDSHITFMLDKGHADVISGIPEIDEIILYDKGKKDPSYFFEMLRLVKSKKFDLSVVLWSTTKEAWLCYLSGIKTRVGQGDRILYSFLYNKPVEVRSSKRDDITHWVDILLDYGRVLNLEKIERRLSFYIPTVDLDFATSLLSSCDITENDLLIGLHIGKGLSVDLERWPVKKFSKIADLLVEKFKAKIIFTGTSEERKLVNLAQGLMNYDSFNFAGKLSLKQLGALIKRLNLFICLDSGPMHIAAALKVPCVAIFALKSDFPMRWRPFGTRCEIVRSFSSNCTRKCIKEKCRRFICLEEIDENEVAEAAGKLLK